MGLQGRAVVVLSCAAALLSVAPAAASAKAAPVRPHTTWLCRPGVLPDPCAPGLSTTVISPGGAQTVKQPKQVKHPGVDCFYVYPTVSDQKTPLANFRIDPELRSIALYQVARYSQYCRVFAPVYEQVTISELAAKGVGAVIGMTATGIADVRRAFADYLAHFNHGRGFVLIGHSQGSFVLDRLIAQDVDPKPAVRRRLVSAILLGGNVQVRQGTGLPADFPHIPACRSPAQLACVVAFSTFDAPVPANSLFGRPLGVAMRALCTNPAALGGGSGVLDPIVPSAPFAPGTTIAAGIALLGVQLPRVPTVWLSQPGKYAGACSSADGADVLQIMPRDGTPAPRPVPDPSWGLHLMDANVALGNLVNLVRTEASALARRGR